jgi:hypothetical protein
MKETIFINLEPYEWRHSLRAERGRRYNGRGLQTAARITQHDIELLNTDAKLNGLTVHLSIMDGKPTMGDGQSFEGGIGLFVFNEKQPGGDDYGPQDAMVIGWFFLDTNLYNELWSQVAADRYSSCSITVTVGPVTFQSLDWAWDVKANKKLFIEDVSIEFVRDKTKVTEVPPPRRGFFG